MQEERKTHEKWVFDKNSDDLRGWSIIDRSGRRHGVVKRMLVDPKTEHIVEVEVEDGKRFSAHDLLIGDRTLTLETITEAKTKAASVATTVAAIPIRKEEVKPVALVQPPAVDLPPKQAVAPAPPVAPMRAVPAPAPARVAAPVTAPVTAVKSSAQAARDDRDDLLLQLLDEEIAVEKRRFRAGGVHVETHVVSEPYSEEVRLRDERVTIDRKKVDRDLKPEEVDQYFHDENIEMAARAELPVVEKSARITEEVVLKRRADDHVEEVHDTIRHMHATVTQLPADAMIARGGEKR